MANIKISELTALTPPDAADLVPVTDSSASQTKRTTVGEIVGIINGDVDVADDGTATISELPVSKLQDGDARQLLQTDAAGTGVEWTSDVSVASAAVSDLTSGRVVLAGTGGELEDSAGLTFNGTQLDVDGNVVITGDLTVSGTGAVSSRTVATDAGGDATIFAQNNSSNICGSLVYGSSKAAYGVIGSNEGAFYANTPVSVVADGANPIKFGTGVGAVERLRITSNGELKHIGGGSEGDPAVYFAGSAPAKSLYVEATTGHVGVGSSSPNYQLDLGGGTTVATRINIARGSDDSNAMRLGYKTIDLYRNVPLASAQNGLAINQVGSDGTRNVLQIDSSGNVGIAPNGAGGYDVLFNPGSSSSPLVRDSSGRLLVGTSSSTGSARAVFQGNSFSSGQPGIILIQRDTSSSGLTAGAAMGYIIFGDNVGSNYAVIGCEADGATGTNDYPSRLVFSTTADGASSPTTRMTIESTGAIKLENGASNLYRSGASGSGLGFSTNCTIPLNETGAASDNTENLGAAGTRWATVYAGTGTINTSDANLKQDVDDLDAAELLVATAIKGLVKKYRFKDAVEAKGDDARIHVGVVAQEVEQAFVNAGLDPRRYALFCEDELEDGTKRLGIRYDELLAFVIAAL